MGGSELGGSAAARSVGWVGGSGPRAHSGICEIGSPKTPGVKQFPESVGVGEVFGAGALIDGESAGLELPCSAGYRMEVCSVGSPEEASASDEAPVPVGEAMPEVVVPLATVEETPVDAERGGDFGERGLLQASA